MAYSQVNTLCFPFSFFPQEELMMLMNTWKIKPTYKVLSHPTNKMTAQSHWFSILEITEGLFHLALCK